MASRHGDTGGEEWKHCLEAVDDSIEGVFDRFESEYIDDQPLWDLRIGKSNPDDPLDGIPLAHTAKLGADRSETLPIEPPMDDVPIP